eukprot:Nitzschia sp. Nitz4//scaffold22_size323478//269544//271562//NITZ4_000577-RA/size323478-augustus-gene-0.248-mRNA-1//-1//CDS//3329543145//6790//frame0
MVSTTKLVLASTSSFLLFEAVEASVRTEGIRLLSARNVERKMYTDAELEYFQDCEDSFLDYAVMADGLISQNEFASSYATLCSQYTSGYCEDSFAGLPYSVQAVFFDAVCSNMKDPEECAQNLRVLNSMDFGYIVTAEIIAEVQVQVETFCIEMMGRVFDSDYTKAPTDATSSPTPSPSIGITFSPTASQTGTGFSGNLPTVGNATDDDIDDTVEKNSTGTQGTSDTLDLTAVDEDDEVTDATGSGFSVSDGPMLGIATATAACVLVLAVVAFRRRQQSKVHQKGSGAFGDLDMLDDTSVSQDIAEKGLAGSSDSGTASITSFGATTMDIKVRAPGPEHFQSGVARLCITDGIALKCSSIGPIEDAVDDANWDEVYRLASELAEKEDLSTLSSAGRRVDTATLQARLQRRTHLSGEDLERTRNLDELIDNRDWTGVAVTAALYAGESGYNGSQTRSDTSYFSMGQDPETASTGENSSIREPPSSVDGGESLLSLKDSMDQAVEAGDWDQVLQLSSEVENNSSFRSRQVGVGEGQGKQDEEAPQVVLQREMDQAINRGDWAMVGYYADKIKEYNATGELVPENESMSSALVPASMPVSRETDKSGSMMDKKTTIQRLAQAQKWKGLSIMAGLYEMESKGSLSTDLGNSSL